jgi:hypothetical protein
MTFQPPKPSLKPLFQVEVLVAEALEVGTTSAGQRRVIPIIGGTFQGDRLRGKVLSGGADWQIVTSDGVALLEARYTLQTHDNALIYVKNVGVRYGSKEILKKMVAGEIIDPAQYYFRTTPRFETGAAQYTWLNYVIAVASGVRTQEAVILDFYELL